MVKEIADSFSINFDLFTAYIRKVSDPLSSVLLVLFDSLTELDEDEARDGARELAKEHFQRKFAERFLVYPILAVVCISAISILDWSQQWKLSDQLYGLSLDFLGAIILGRGLLMGGVAIGAVTTTKYGYNPLLVKSMAKDSVDGVWGVSLILLGIAIQTLVFL